MYAAIAKQTWGASGAPETNAAITPTDTAVKPTAGMLSGGDEGLFTFGMPTGYTQKDLGDGRYEMFDASGNSAGYGYKGVRDAYNEIGWNNAAAKTTQSDGAWVNPYLTTAKMLWGEPTTDWQGNAIEEYVDYDHRTRYLTDSDLKKGEGEYTSDQLQALGFNGKYRIDNNRYNSKEEVDAALRGLLDSKEKNFNGTMGEWEALGQVLQGEAFADAQNWGNLPTNQKEEVIKGASALFGSTPVFGKDGGLLGYRTDITPNEAKDFSNGKADNVNQEEYGTFIKHDGRNHSWSNANWRELNDPEWWKNNTVVGENGKVFVPKESVDSISGWTNKDSYQHQENDEGRGLFGTIWNEFDVTQDLLYAMDPKVADDVGKVTSVVAPLVIDYFVPGLGRALAAADAVTRKDTLGAVLNAAAAGWAAYGAAAGSAASTATSTPTENAIDAGALGGASTSAAGATSAFDTAKAAIDSFNKLTLSDITGVSIPPSVDKVVMGAAKSAVKSAAISGLKGDDLQEVFMNALSAAAVNLVGGTIGATTNSNLAGSVAGAATGSLIGNAMKDTPSQTGTTATTTTKPTTSGGASANADDTPVWKQIYASIAKQSWSAQ